MYAAFPRSEYHQRIRLRTVASVFLRHKPFRPTYLIRVGRRPRPQWISQVPRCLRLRTCRALGPRRSLRPPRHLRCDYWCLPATTTLSACGYVINEAQSLHSHYGPLVALSTLSPICYLLGLKTRFPVRRLHLLPGREFHPLEAPGLSWRPVVEHPIHFGRSRTQPSVGFGADFESQRARE
jgi:hypothetical protein